MKKGDKINFKITHVGAPIVNHGYVREIGDNLVAIEIDLKSKYCDIDCFVGGSDGYCGLHIGTTDRSLRLNEKVNRDESTAISFIDFNGWSVFAANIGRYTLSVCLIKKEEY